MSLVLGTLLALGQLAPGTALAGTSSLAPTGDAWVDSGNPTVNHGTNGFLQLDNSPVLRGYLAFSVAVPAGEQVTSAQLQVVPKTSNPGGFDVRTSDTTWTETSITYASAPVPSTAASGTSGPLTAGVTASVDVTGAVPATGGAVSLVLSNLTSTSYAVNSKEATSGRPALVVTTAPTTGGTGPTASFTTSPSSGTAPLAVTFGDTSTGVPTSWAWDFGDGGTSTAQNPTHTFAAGTWTVRLTASNNAGSNASTGTVSATASTTGDVGVRDMSYVGAVAAPTGEKPESKLWFNDGSWWGDLFDTVSKTHHIWRLDRATQTWVDTGTPIDNRTQTKSDVLWDGSKLYVASHVFASSSSAATAGAGNETRLYRYSYSATSKTYSLDDGFPTTANNTSAEAVVLTRDSLGQLWVTWTAQSKAFANRSNVGGTSWGAPFVLPTPGASLLDSDDIPAIVNTGSGKVAVLWSNQKSGVLWLGLHPDSASVSSNWTFSVVRSGNKQVDDHISLRSLDRDSSGRLFAVVKTSLNDVVPVDPNAPLNVVLVYTPSTGSWTSAAFGQVKDNHTRAILELDSTNNTVHVFATGPATAGSGAFQGNIYEKSSPMGALSFTAGLGTPVIRDTHSAAMNNVTSTKQTVSSATGLVVLAGNDSTQRYWHADVPLTQ